LATEEPGTSEATGPLAENISSRSLQRWDFWRQQLQQLVDSGDIQGDAKQRATEAIKMMDSFLIG
jgi:hypothetical protein